MSPEAIGAPALAWTALVFLGAGFAHGALGFGFPLVATPLVALATDMRTAIALVAPVTLLMCVLSVVRGGRAGALEALRRFWFLLLAMAVGSYAGTRLLIVAEPTPFLAALAVMLVVYLGLEHFRTGASALVARARVAFGLAFGLAAGVCEATVNVALPPLIVYFMLLGIAPSALVQTLNLCFSVGKGVQVGTWALYGGVAASFWGTAALLCVPAAATLYRGMRLRERIDATTYRRWLRRALGAMALVLAGQFAWLRWLT